MTILYLSSTYEDLKKFCEAVDKAAQERLGRYRWKTALPRFIQGVPDVPIVSLVPSVVGPNVSHAAQPCHQQRWEIIPGV